MSFEFTHDQMAMRSALREVLSAHCTPSTVRAAWGEKREPVSTLWPALGDVGLLGICVPEEHGGTGGSEIEFALLLEECGRFAVPGPLVTHVGVVAPILASVHDPLVSNLVEGVAIGTAQEPGTGLVRWVRESDVALGWTGDSWTLMDEPLVDEAVISIDRSITIGHARCANPSPLPANSVHLTQRSTVGVSAELLGLADSMIDMAVSYAKSRTQFGRVVGSQQAVKHRLADARVLLEHARPAVYRAAWAVAIGDDNADRDVSFAKMFAQRSAEFAARASLQVHGAIGYTWEHDLHLWMKRVWSLRAMWGTEEAHRQVLANALLGPEVGAAS